MFLRFPEVIEKLRIYERIVAAASKRGQATFFAAKTTPQGAQLVRAQKLGLRTDEPLPQIDSIAEWAKTTHGGRQFDMLNLMIDDDLGCTSQYGLCE